MHKFLCPAARLGSFTKAHNHASTLVHVTPQALQSKMTIVLAAADPAGTQPCQFFIQGHCVREKCRFGHDLRSRATPVHANFGSAAIRPCCGCPWTDNWCSWPKISAILALCNTYSGTPRQTKCEAVSSHARSLLKQSSEQATWQLCGPGALRLLAQVASGKQAAPPYSPTRLSQQVVCQQQNLLAKGPARSCS